MCQSRVEDKKQSKYEIRENRGKHHFDSAQQSNLSEHMGVERRNLKRKAQIDRDVILVVMNERYVSVHIDDGIV